MKKARAIWLGSAGLGFVVWIRHLLRALDDSETGIKLVFDGSVLACLAIIALIFFWKAFAEKDELQTSLAADRRHAGDVGFAHGDAFTSPSEVA
jgi:hypothetical protein